MTPHDTCPLCNGSRGELTTTTRDGEAVRVYTPCTLCAGSGIVPLGNTINQRLREAEMRAAEAKAQADAWQHEAVAEGQRLELCRSQVCELRLRVAELEAELNHPDRFNSMWTISPGAVLADLMHDAGLTVATLAHPVNLPVDALEAFLRGERWVDERLAKGLACVLGGTPESWYALELLYRRGLRQGKADTSTLPTDPHEGP